MAALSVDEGRCRVNSAVEQSPVITVQCDKCGRRGRYHVDRLIERYGIDAKLFDWELEADCPRKVARNEHDPCGARFPYLF